MSKSFDENIKENRERLKRVKLNREEELKADEEDMLKSSHKGEFCWLTGKTYCQEGWCLECVIYQDWKESLKKVSVG